MAPVPPDGALVPDTLTGLLATALASRAPLVARLDDEGTDVYRLFHGDAEGEAGLTVDRYGDLLLVESRDRSLEPARLAEAEAFYGDALPGLDLIYNDRGGTGLRIRNTLPPERMRAALAPRQVREMGVNYRVQGRHDSRDSWLSMELRAGRRRVMREMAATPGGKSLLSLFAFTCGIGIAAARAGARFVVNVDPGEASLKVGRENARLNDLPIRPRFLHSDVFAALRQFSGLGQSGMVRGRRMPAFPKLEPQQFDLVFLDPPRYAKSPFGVVDLVNDYAALFKPALLSTAAGGTLICTNQAAEVAGETWLDQMERGARKAGRPIREMEWIAPDADFPGFDGGRPLKVALLRV
jgi:23S rRNA (cytosine1962-C5)-methyltransferase